MIVIATVLVCFYVDIPWWVCLAVIGAAVKLEIALDQGERR